MTKVELLNQVSSFIDTFKLVSNNEDDYMCQIKMTNEIKAQLSSWEDEGLLLTIEDLASNNSPEAEDTVIDREYRVSISLVNLHQDGVEIYSNWSQFFKKSKNKHIIPDSFYIISDKSKFTGDTESLTGDLKHYINTVVLIKILLDQADHTDIVNGSNVPNAIMLHKNRLEIPCNYKLEDIQSGIDGITHISKWIKDESHKDQRVSIFKTALYDFLKSVQKDRRFEYLLTHFGEFSAQVIENYDLFVSEFSFDDVRLEYQEKKREYMLKINETFSSIQTKALGIPVSLAFVALRLSTSKTGDVTEATNMLLFASALVYGLMMWLLIQNQKHSLKSIETEYQGQINRLKKKYPEHHAKIASEFADLDKRCRTQRFQLNFFLVLIVGLVLIVYTHLDISLSSTWGRMLDWILENSTKGWEIILLSYTNSDLI
ncbi:hypothetical protein [Vibrio parahaemolyticus]|uniref:hypothetical protein n=1 Tax=Vibrio parahaemolyticus TaxID=670 RepID=UPI00047015F3|nr:hypothetical protein [Vibrio parahaemolyticus]MDW9222039.1 hypothetical protein [Vibrio parahaemolyticus]HEQ3516354.1 hypothetical protein [Vibrio cholerae]HEQ3579446.1 hypothetical protein [Vibrio cholerae]